MATVYGPVPLLNLTMGAPGAPDIDRGQMQGIGPRWSGWAGHFHRPTRQPDPGTDAFAYQALGLAEFTPIGPGTANRDQLRPIPPHSTLFAGQAVPVQGVGGLVMGQYITQALLVPAELQSEPLGTDENWIGLP